jgi:hypothetical protein
VRSLYFEQHKTDPKIKLCVCKEILNGIRKAGCIAHKISGTLFMGYSQNLLFIDTFMLQFHNIASLIDSHEHSYETIGTKQ